MLSGIKNAFKTAVSSSWIEPLQPSIREEVGENIDSLRTYVLAQIPPILEAFILKQTQEAEFIGNLLKPHIGPIITKLVEKMRPEVVEHTEGLKDIVTGEIMENVRELLHLTPPTPGGPATVSVPGGGNRGLEGERSLFGGNEGGDGDGDRGLGSVFNIKAKLPEFEARVRAERVHPLFEGVKPNLWDVVVGAFKDAVDDIVGERAERGIGTETERGLFSNIMDTFQGSIRHKVKDLAGDVLEMVREPVQQMIGELVDRCEDGVMRGADVKIREVVEKIPFL
ncbi:hypothetical protein HK104_007634 [Borealophlyctis nickersoniae]|nr:hypothetical protein HK104_007634 [Borealophlyctis nickersoniae]